MMELRLTGTAHLAAALVLVCGTPGIATAQAITLNYDELSSLEEPIAFNLGEVTVALTGLVDIPLALNLEGPANRGNVEPGFIGNFEVSAQTQLSNRWRVGAAYFGQYATSANASIVNPDDYSDNIAGFVGTSFGTVLGGNVSGQVREQTRRRRGAGNAFLKFDDFLGELDNWGGAYVGRFGPAVLSTTVDENGDFEAGAFFQRPIGHKDYRFSLRVADSRFLANDHSTRFDTKGISTIAEFVYGSSRFDIGGGYEHFASSIIDTDRWFVSAGARTKIGPLDLSAEGHYGKTAGDSEKSAALGAAYDLAAVLTLDTNAVDYP